MPQVYSSQNLLRNCLITLSSLVRFPFIYRNTSKTRVKVLSPAGRVWLNSPAGRGLVVSNTSRERLPVLLARPAGQSRPADRSPPEAPSGTGTVSDSSGRDCTLGYIRRIQGRYLKNEGIVWVCSKKMIRVLFQTKTPDMLKRNHLRNHLSILRAFRQENGRVIGA